MKLREVISAGTPVWICYVGAARQPGLVVDDSGRDPVLVERIDSGRVEQVPAARLAPRKVIRQRPLVPDLAPLSPPRAESPRPAFTPSVAVPKHVPARSSRYRDFLRALPCSVCSYPAPSEVSHHGAHGTGTKASDYGAIPACHRCHAEWHSRGAYPGLPGDASRVHVARTVARILPAFLDLDDRRQGTP